MKKGVLPVGSQSNFSPTKNKQWRRLAASCREVLVTLNQELQSRPGVVSFQVLDHCQPRGSSILQGRGREVSADVSPGDPGGAGYGGVQLFCKLTPGN